METFLKNSVITLISSLVVCSVFFLGTACAVDSSGYNFMEYIFFATLIGMGLFAIVAIIHAIVIKQVRKENRQYL